METFDPFLDTVKNTQSEMVQISAIRKTIYALHKELNKEARALQKALAAPPLTASQAYELAVNDYTNGKSRELEVTKQELSQEVTNFEKEKRRTENLGESLGFNKYLPKFLLIEPLAPRSVEMYEQSLTKINIWRADLNKRIDEFNLVYQELQKKMKTPGVRDFIEQRSRAYSIKEQKRLEMNVEREARLAEISEQQKAINRFMNEAVPASQWDKQINITGDAKDPYNLLAQTDQIKAQTSTLAAQQQEQRQAYESTGVSKVDETAISWGLIS